MAAAMFLVEPGLAASVPDFGDEFFCRGVVDNMVASPSRPVQTNVGEHRRLSKKSKKSYSSK